MSSLSSPYASRERVDPTFLLSFFFPFLPWIYSPFYQSIEETTGLLFVIPFLLAALQIFISK